jgi:prepilin-type N-terminal cleavage/methylation domain-containing protein
MMGRTRAGQKGFTLIELLVAIPIAALVMLAASGAIVQLVRSGRASAQMNAIRQVQMAGTWISRDGLQAESVSIGSGNGFPCTFEWHDYTAADAPTHTVVYILIPMSSGGLSQLQRRVTIEGGTTTTTIVARNLVSASTATALSWTDDTRPSFKLEVTSTAKQKTVTRTYEVTPRPEGAG